MINSKTVANIRQTSMDDKRGNKIELSIDEWRLKAASGFFSTIAEEKNCTY
jgi:hypothetical protein